MKIDGKLIAAQINNVTKIQIEKLKKNNITPKLCIFLVGEDEASKIYINQKIKLANQLNVETSVHKFTINQTEEYKKTLFLQVHNPEVHGIIIQQPLPDNIPDLTHLIPPQKDVDGFLPNSPFEVPVAKAVYKTLNYIKNQINESLDINHYLKTQKIVIIGKGKRGGKPISDLFHKYNIVHSVVSKTLGNIKDEISQADIIISCVGIKNIISPENIKPNTILIGVGISRENGKVIGDYDEEKIQDKCAFYTPTPGGIGPINVACLFENVVTSATTSHK